MFKDPVRTAQ